VLSAHEAKDALRNQMLLDELCVIEKNLALLAEPKRIDLKAILEFEKKYRAQIQNRHKHIIPPHFDSARKIPIDSLYVEPSFIAVNKKQSESPNLLKMTNFLSIIYRSVLLGTPGGGKSTLSMKLCHDLAASYSGRLLGNRQVTPVLVILRDYGAEKKSHNYSLLQYIEAMATSKYQITPPKGAFEYLLLNSRVVIVFDGLDELLDTSDRQVISSDIESFCSLYPNVPVLVTSREVGYEQAPLDEAKFDIFRLAPFDDKQVQEYVGKWFKLEKDLTQQEQTKRTKMFIEESRIVPDLRSNPLMLALMCNIYRGENYIPRNRPDLYDKCATMLFERWDKGRGIYVSLPFEVHIKPAMMYLAHWIYSNGALQSGVTEGDLIAKTTDYLFPKRYEDRDEAEEKASEFIKFCRGRAWVFTDTGTTKSGERLYQFTHRTFLEYFTASHLVRNNPTPDKLKEVLVPRIIKREWDVVAQLSFQLQNKNIEGAGDELLLNLINQSSLSNFEGDWNLLLFGARCLEFIVPTPKTVRIITESSIDKALDWGVKFIKKELNIPANRSDGCYEPQELICPILLAANENRPTIADTLEKKLNECIENWSYPDIVAPIEFILNIRFNMLLFSRSVQPELIKFWVDITERIYNKYSKKIQELCPKEFPICTDILFRSKIALSDFVNWHGISAIFRSREYILFPNLHSISLAEYLIDIILGSYYREITESHLEEQFSKLKEIGNTLNSFPTPWFTENDDFVFFSFHWINMGKWNRPVKTKKLKGLDKDVLFGVFVLFATLLEVIKKQVNFEEKLEGIEKSRNPFFDNMCMIFLARFKSIDQDMIEKEISKRNFAGKQRDLIYQWIRKEINFTGDKVGIPASSKISIHKGTGDVP
jgi:hypothetical protein